MRNDELEQSAAIPQEQPAPSKTQRKREAHALQRLGTQLVELKPSQLTKLPLPEELLNAVEAAQTMTRRGARKRQLQYIGKLMRQIDPEPIEAALQALQTGSVTARREQRDLEQLYDSLLSDEQTALAGLIGRHPDTDRQYLRQLLRNIRREQQQNKPVRSRKTLLAYLRELTETSG